MRVPGRRYVLLETLRAYGAELLAEDGTADDVGRRHAFYVVEQIEAADRALIGPRADQLLENIDAGLPELRVAFSWLLEHGELEAAGRIMVALWNYGFLRLRPDVLAWADRLTAADAGDHSPLAAGVWAVSAQAAWMSGDLAETARRTERAAAVAEGSTAGESARVATMQGSQALFEGRLDDSARHYRRARALASSRAQGLTALGCEVLALAYAGRRNGRRAGRHPARRGGGRGRPPRRLRLVLRRRVRPHPRPRPSAGAVCPRPRSRAAQRGIVRERGGGHVERLHRGPPRRSRGGGGGVPAPAHPLAPRRHVVDPVDDAALDRRAPRCAGEPRGLGGARRGGAGHHRGPSHLR